MPNKNNIWYKAFNNPKLKEEKWLDPSDALFNNISNQVFEKKKKRRGLVFWFMGFGIFIGLLVMVFTINPFNSNDSSLGDAQLNNTQKNPQKINMERSLPVDDIVLSESKPLSLVKKNEEVKNVQEGALSNPIKKYNSGESDQVNMNSDVNGASISVSQARAQTDFLVSSQQLQANNSRITETGNTGFSSPSSSMQNQSVNFNQSVNVVVNKELPLMDRLNLLGQLLLIAPSQIDFDRPHNLDLAEPSIPIQVLNTDNGKNILGLTIGLSQWNFTLNSDYQSALDPADFTFDSGKGWNVGLLYARKLSNRFSLSSSIQMERILFHSGHNSSVDYILNEETQTSMSNDRDLTMASPLGFLESNLVINRGNNANLNELDLVIDLHNTHRIYNVSLSTGIEYLLIKSSLVDISALGGVGVNYFSSVSNELSSFDIDREGFQSGMTQINKDQERINHVTPLLEMGLSLSKELCTDLHTGFSIRHRRTVRPIYSEGDFSTRFSTFDVRWMISKSF